MVIMDIRLESMETRPVKLKFGIDALLSNDRFASSKEKESAILTRDNQAVSSDEEYSAAGLGQTTILNISKPLPQMPPQCSDCVSSLFGCCRLGSSGNCARDNLPGLPRYLGGHHVTYNPNTSGGPVFTVQPIRPFATRPALRIPISHSSSSQSSVMSTGGGGGTSKRKRSWSRAVFSNLQRKGLERRFQIQKYITKPDRRQLAATLGLTDAQVKVWFQNRRMKWRHATLKSGDIPAADSTQEEELQIDIDTIHDEDM